MAAAADLPDGVGLGWRPQIDVLVERLAEDGVIGFSEVIAENLSPALHHAGGLPASLQRLRQVGPPVIPHGVSLSLGSADPADVGDGGHLARCAEALGSPLVSEHLAFVRGGGLEAGHLLPCPRTPDAVDVLCDNINRVVDALPVPLAVEMPAALLTWPDDVYTDAQFVTEVLQRSPARLMLDIANVYANAVNSGNDPARELRAYPLERLAYCHIAGGYVDHEGIYIDSHVHPVLPQVLELAAYASALVPGLPVLLERDGNYPADAQLTAEVRQIARVLNG